MSTARGSKRAPAKPASLATNPPTFEHIVTGVNETFLWRLDNYPWERNVWNFHPEIEIHLIRKASGLAFVGDHIGQFGPGYLTVIGSNLYHIATIFQQVITRFGNFIGILRIGIVVLEGPAADEFGPAERERTGADVTRDLHADRGGVIRREGNAIVRDIGAARGAAIRKARLRVTE